MDIVIQNLSKRCGEKQVLQDLSVRIPQGSVCAIMAPSGTGKTTLLRLILGLEQPDSGTISGIPARKSALFQEDRLCPNLSAIQNLRMAVPKCSAETAKEILTALGLGNSMEKPVSTLSGGMSRRAALARALAADSDLIILDEPFTGLDEDTRNAAATVIRNHRRNRTLIFVTHREDDLGLLEAEMVMEISR